MYRGREYVIGCWISFREFKGFTSTKLSYFTKITFTILASSRLKNRNVPCSGISILLIKPMTQMNFIFYFCFVIIVRKIISSNELVQISTLPRRIGLMISHYEIISYIRTDQKEERKWMFSVQESNFDYMHPK